VLELAALLSRRALVAAAVALLAPLLATAGLHVPGRPVLAVTFFLLVPGVAFAELLDLPSVLASWCVAIGTSLAVNILVAQFELVLGRWHPLFAQWAVAVLAITMTIGILLRRRATTTVAP